MKTPNHHQRHVGSECILVERHGGAKARGWRRQVALSGKAGSRPPAPPMKTLVFPLKVDIPLDLFSVSAAHYATIEGTGPGSLYQLLMRVHLAGLRPYGSEGDAAAARNESRFPNAAFEAAAVATFGASVAPITPQFLFTQFQRTPRIRGGRAPVFNVDEVVNWLHKGCFGKSMAEDVDAGLRSMLATLAEVVVDTASGYSDLARRAPQVLSAVGTRLQQLEPAFPPLNVDLPNGETASPLAYTGVVDPTQPDEPPQYWLHHVVARLLLARPGMKVAEVQDHVLSPTNNALSQLFNKMIGDGGQLRQADPEVLRQELGIPLDRLPQVRELIEAAQSVPAPQLFDESNYAGYRPNFGGRIRSWIANYLTRLETLRTQLNEVLNSLGELPTPTTELREILAGLRLNWAELQAMFRQLAVAVEDAQLCVAVLKGLDESMRPIAAAQALERHLRDMADIRGSLNQIRKQLMQREGSNGDEARRAWIDALDVGDASVFALPGIHWGAEDAEAELAQINQQLVRLLKATQAIHRLAAPDGRVDMETYLAQLRDDETSRHSGIHAANGHHSIDCGDLARRRFLQNVCGLAQRLSPELANRVWGWLQPLVMNSPGRRVVPAVKVFNRIRFNQQGRFYVSPWSRSRHQPVVIDWERFAQHDWAAAIAELRAVASAGLQEAPSAEALQDHIEVERFVAQMAVSAMSTPLDRQTLEAQVDVAALEPHPRLAAALRADQLDRQTLSRLLALVDGYFSKLRFPLRRPAFVIRHKFSRIEQTKLLLVPKARPWTPPRKYFVARGPIAEALRALPMFQPDQPVDAVAAFHAVAAQPLGPAAGALLKQIPHDLHVALGFRQPVGSEVEAIVLSKDLHEHVRLDAASPTPPANNSRRHRWPVERKPAVRLVGASSFTNRITDALIGRTLINEWTLILDWKHESAVVMRDGYPAITAQLIQCCPRIAVPITPQQDEDAPAPLFERFVAIDLGERQIGYAVFDVREALSATEAIHPITDPLTRQPAVGAVRVPGVRRLIRSVKTHRQRQSGVSKVRDRYDRRLESIREVVTGQIAHIIESLCARFKAFPVLESSVTNFQTGSRQLDLVYGNVVRLYNYSPDADAHNKLRAEHWMGADKWTHPYLYARQYEQATGRRGNRSQPLNLFPGSSIHPAGTSQTCVHCLRNPIGAFRRLEERAPSQRIEVDQDGVVHLDDGDVRLMRGADYPESVLKAARRSKRNLPLNDPLPAGTYDPREVFAAIRRTMRQKPPSVMAKDTTQSRYQCLYIDCGQTYHADAGAAINIGRKFFREKIDVQRSAEELRKVCKTFLPDCRDGTIAT